MCPICLAAERDDLMKANALLHALIGNREAEIEQLRAALKQITSGGLGLFGSKQVARDALEQKSPLTHVTGAKMKLRP
jgi:hypothetical protein